MVTLIASYQVSEGNEERVADLLRDYIPLTRAEPGCVSFVAHQSTEDPAIFILYEQYVDQAAFDAHAASAHYDEVAAKQIRPLLADRKVIFLNILEPADGGGA